MHRRPLTSAALAALLGVGVSTAAARTQDAPSAPPATAARVSLFAVRAVPTLRPPTAAVLKRLDQKTVTVSLNNADSRRALYDLLNATGFAFEFDRSLYDEVIYEGKPTLDLPARELTLKLVDAPVPRALDAVTRSIGVGWTAEADARGGITIRILRTARTQTPGDLMRRQQREMEERTRRENETLARGGVVFGGGGLGGIGGGLAAYGFGPTPPAVRVRLDLGTPPGGDVREALRSVLTQARVDFALDEDVPTGERRALAFENVLLATALDVICQGAGLGWRTEQTPRGLLVRVGKRYAPPSPPDAAVAR